MECSICFQKFSAAERRPKSLPCGHSYCLPCVKQLPNKECPMDRKRFKAAADKLPDNFMLIQLKQEKDAASAPTPPASPAPTTTPRLWCRSCNSECAESCADEHPASLCSLKKAREDKTAPRLAALQTAEEALRGLRSQLDAAADGLDVELAASRGRLVDELDALDRERQRLQAAVEAGEASVEEASEAADLNGLARSAARLLPALADPASELGVSLKGQGGTWTASIRPEQRPAATLLLCTLACAGELRREGADEDQPDGEAAAADGSSWKERSNAGERDDKSMMGRLKKDCRVARGADWPAGSVVDGQPPRPGTVVEMDGTKITVEWDCGNKACHVMGLQREGKVVYELKILPYVSYTLIGRVKSDSPAFMDVHKISCSFNVAKKLDFLSTAELDKIRVLVNLWCDVSPAWSKEVLKKVAPQLESLRLLQPDADHLRIAEGMPKLWWLSLLPADTQTLQMALSMPGLVQLEAHCPFEAPLGALRMPDKPSLTFLFLGIHPLSVALAIVRANASTLKFLWLAASSREPYGCPDLAEELRRCGLKKLEELRLCRETEMQFCQHDVDSCRQQRLQLFDMFLATGLKVKVTCSICGDS